MGARHQGCGHQTGIVIEENSVDLGLKGKVAIITGSTEGIGRATALKFAKEGTKVAICSRDAAKVERTVAEIKAAGGEVFGMVADISKAADIENFVNGAVNHFGRVDILVNNAGSSQRGAFLETEDAKWASDFELKIFGAIRCTRLAVPHMIKQGGGRVINITNTAAKQPGAESGPTSISRAAGLALTKMLSKEFAPKNVLVNTVTIGKIKSGQHERTRKKLGLEPDVYFKKVAADIPMGRMGETDEAADAIVFLASNMATYVTGTSINLDGGISGVL
jgi:NAD(P)-dependent dehydrogenase (short-subunit alcohol dehydrogenase family)